MNRSCFVTGWSLVLVGCAAGPHPGGGDSAVEPFANEAMNNEAMNNEAAIERVVDASTVNAKMLMGYQGWFGCPSDGSELSQWMHWSPGTMPSAETVSFDAWPDTQELSASELCATDMRLGTGETGFLYSAYNAETVERHTRWMAEYDIDGVFLQRFTSELRSPHHKEFRDQVARNIRDGAEANGRVFAIMYDISGHDPGTLVDTLKNDWMYLVDSLGLTESERYLHHRRAPLVAIWGLGFNDRPGTAAEALELVDWFHGMADERYRATVMGGVPTHWRTRTGDALPDPAWTTYYHSLDILSPWSVGRYATPSGADAFRRDLVEPDLAEASWYGIDYMPVVFPGFSWSHLTDDAGEFNAIPRLGGQFYWRQVYNAVGAGASMIYTAMFDEVDEATAMFKLAPSQDDTPEDTRFLTLDTDGDALPADWYLSLGGAATQMLRGELPLTSAIPITAMEPERPESDDDAAMVSYTFPFSMRPDEIGEGRITVRNTGSTVWTREAGYKLGAVGDSDLLHEPSRIWLPEDAEVLPGQAYTFNINLTAPTDISEAVSDWQMVHEAVHWFGETASFTVWIDLDETESEPETEHMVTVTRAYRGILGREPDSAGLTYYAAQLSTEMTPTDLCVNLWTSEEFAMERSGLSPEEMAIGLYQGILSRSPDPGGLSATISAIEEGAGPLRAADMLNSEEAASL